MRTGQLLALLLIVLAVPVLADRSKAEHWAEEFLDTSFDGTVTTEEEDLTTIASGDLVYQSSRVRDLVIRVYGSRPSRATGPRSANSRAWT